MCAGERVGSCERVAWALLVEPLLLPSPVPLAAQIWGGRHFEKFKTSYPGRSLRRARTWAPRLVSVPSILGRAVHPTRSQGPKTTELTGEGELLPPHSREPWEPWEP